MLLSFLSLVIKIQECCLGATLYHKYKNNVHYSYEKEDTPGASKTVQEPPCACEGLEEPPGASKCIKEPPGVSKLPLGASKGLYKPPGASKGL